MIKAIAFVSVLVAVLAGCAATTPTTGNGVLAPVVQSPHAESKPGIVATLWVPSDSRNDTFLIPVAVPGRYASFVSWPGR